MKTTAVSKGGKIAAIVYLVYAVILVIIGFIKNGWETIGYFFWAGFPASIVLIPLGAVLIFFIAPATILSIIISMRFFYFLGAKIEQHTAGHSLGSKFGAIGNKINPIGKRTPAAFVIKMMAIGLLIAIITIYMINTL